MQSRHPALPCHPRHRRSDRPGAPGHTYRAGLGWYLL